MLLTTPDHKKIHSMLTAQNTLNRVVNEGWIHAKYAWHRAIMVEAVEALEHYGWKWWKLQISDMDQVKMELVDIWHFILSKLIEKNGRVNDHLVESIIADIKIAIEDNNGAILNQYKNLSTHEKFDRLICGASKNEVYLLSECGLAFFALMTDLDMSFDELFILYTGKCVLNTLRQNHGYKNGTYQKYWIDQEDNVHVISIIRNNLDLSADQLYFLVEQRYKSCVIK